MSGRRISPFSALCVAAGVLVVVFVVVLLVAGLTAPGTYTFTLTLVDRNAYATRDVSVNVLLPEPAMVVGVVCMLALRRAGARC